MESYVRGAVGSTPAELAGEYQRLVSDPITENCSDGGEYSQLAASLVSTPILDTRAAGVALDSLDRQRVEVTLAEELERLQETLPGPAVTVCVVIAGDDVARFIAADMDGVTGVTAGAGQIVLLIDPLTMNDEALRYTLAHEYHHSWWTSEQTTAPTFTLIDYLVFEGRADTFASLQHPDHTAPWTDQLTRQQIRELWLMLEPDLESQDPLLLQTVMFGGGQFPQWTGYSIGTQIVQDFITANPSAEVGQWGLLPAADLVADSRFATP